MQDHKVEINDRRLFTAPRKDPARSVFFVKAVLEELTAGFCLFFLLFYIYIAATDCCQNAFIMPEHASSSSYKANGLRLSWNCSRNRRHVSDEVRLLHHMFHSLQHGAFLGLGISV